ncbi:SURF1 family protein [Kineobactrum salinum]|uniref:SURF1-like protein n=1 Tax=Kineobactrum salinum TaxID=2708301 RepID=A0A6C0U1K7_9GAMM|nr:SURF1 family protein [Kineobactrum salinum]QIB65673.1 SURF1 family protein [Kineobactrum salinum]
MRQLQFDFEWRITLVTLLLLPALITLGFWQLQRAEEKAQLQASWKQRQSQAPAELTELPSEPEQLAYRRLVLRGEYLPGRYLLLDNRVRGGRFGYEVVGLFELADSAALVLVNRGWIAGDPARRTLPEVPELAGPVELSAHVYVSPGEPYLLAEQDLAQPWPLRVQALEPAALAPLLRDISDAPLFPYQVRIDPGQPSALAVAWQVVNTGPEKHRGYAFQWFTMALVLGIFLLLRSSNLWQLLIRKRSEV